MASLLSPPLPPAKMSKKRSPAKRSKEGGDFVEEKA
jgi:hypothetical protein